MANVVPTVDASTWYAILKDVSGGVLSGAVAGDFAGPLGDVIPVGFFLTYTSDGTPASLALSLSAYSPDDQSTIYNVKDEANAVVEWNFGGAASGYFALRDNITSDVEFAGVWGVRPVFTFTGGSSVTATTLKFVMVGRVANWTRPATKMRNVIT